MNLRISAVELSTPPLAFPAFLSEGVHMGERYIRTVMGTIGPDGSLNIYDSDLIRL